MRHKICMTRSQASSIGGAAAVEKKESSPPGTEKPIHRPRPSQTAWSGQQEPKSKRKKKVPLTHSLASSLD